MSINLIPRMLTFFNTQKAINVISLISTIKEKNHPIIPLDADKAFVTV